MATLNAKRMLYREPNTQGMEAIENHCNTETGKTQRYRRATDLCRSKKTQSARGWTAADICTIPAPRNRAPIPFYRASRPSLPTAWLALLLTKAGDVESNPGPTTHTNKHTPVIWSYDVCHKQYTRNKH